MKFTTTAQQKFVDAAETEYKMYTYLNAINNSDIEMCGIPSVYYYGQWEDHILMAITLLDSPVTFPSEFDSINELDVLIIFREFVSRTKIAYTSESQSSLIIYLNLLFLMKVRISKYIHSRGVFQNDIKLENMMFRRNQGFIIGNLKPFARSHRPNENNKFRIQMQILT